MRAFCAILVMCLAPVLWISTSRPAIACAYPSTHDVEPTTTAAFIEAACLPVNTSGPVVINLNEGIAFHWQHCGVYPSRLVSAYRSDQAIWYGQSTCCLEELGPDLEWHRIACAGIRSEFLSSRISRTAYGAVPLLVDEPIPDDLLEHLRRLNIDTSMFDLTIKDIRGSFEWDRSALPF